MVIVRTSASRSGRKTVLRKRVLLVCSVIFIKSSMVAGSRAAPSKCKNTELGTDLGQTWDRLRTDLGLTCPVTCGGCVRSPIKKPSLPGGVTGGVSGKAAGRKDTYTESACSLHDGGGLAFSLHQSIIFSVPVPQRSMMPAR